MLPRPTVAAFTVAAAGAVVVVPADVVVVAAGASVVVVVFDDTLLLDLLSLPPHAASATVNANAPASHPNFCFTGAPPWSTENTVRAGRGIAPTGRIGCDGGQGRMSGVANA